MRHTPVLLVVCIATVCATAGSAARAQPNPNVDQIVKSLNPTTSSSGDTRGIRVGPAPITPGDQPESV